MPLVPVDINTIKLDPVSSGLVPVDINTIKLDTPQDRGIIGNRAIEAGQINQDMSAGNIGAIHAGFEQAGNAAGLVGDIGGEALNGAGDAFAYMFPGATGQLKSAGNQVLQAAGSLPSMGGGTLADTIPDELSMLADKYGEFEHSHPIIARDLSSAVNLGALGLGAASAGEDAIKAGVNVAKNVKSKIVRTEKMSSEDLRKMGSALFKKADAIGGTLKPDFTNDFLIEINKQVPQTQFGQVFSGESDVSKLLERSKSLANKPMSLSDAMETDESLGNLAYKNMTDGKFNDDGRRFLDMQRTLRDKIEAAPNTSFVGGKQAFDTVNEARKVWAASLRLRDVERILENAGRQQVPATGIKTGFRTLLRNGNRTKGYSKAELKAMEKAANTGIATDLMATFGSRLTPLAGAGVGGSVGATIGGPIGAAAGSAIGGLASWGGSTAARAGATAIQKGKANTVADMIRSRIIPGAVPPQLGSNLANLLKANAKAAAPISAGYAANKGGKK